MNQSVDPDEITEIIYRKPKTYNFNGGMSMFFMYVYTESSGNMRGECVPISIPYADKEACLNKNNFVIRSLVESEGLDWEEVSRIEVETGEDYTDSGYPIDEDNPATKVCYIRENV